MYRSQLTKRVVAQANPFPAGGLPTAPEIWADRRDVKAALKKTFDLAFAAPETMVIQVYGDYGSGKTHTLKHLAWLLQKDWGEIRTLPVFMENPGTDNVDFYNRFLSALKMDTVVSSLRNMLADVMLSRSNRLQKSRAEGEASGKDIVDALDQDSLIEEVRKSLIEIFRGIGPQEKLALLSDYWEHLATALSRLLMGPGYVYAAAKWLNFQKLYKSDREALNNIPEYSEKPSYTAACIASMLRLVAHVQNYDKVVLFVDELEAVTEPPATTLGLASLVQCLRELIDTGLRELVIVFGTSVTADQVFSESVALQRRVHMTVKLLPLEPSDAIELVSDYLIQSLGRKDKIFEKESIVAFNDVAKGKIGNLIRILNLAYDMSIRNKWSSIDKEQADKVLSEVLRLGILT